MNSRKKKRYTHAYITLKILKSEWVWIKALAWNSYGFNFYLENSDPLQVGESLQFKKGNKTFEGEVAWSKKIKDEEIIKEQILNERIYSHIKRNQLDENSSKRLVNLIRNNGLIDEKSQILNVFEPNFQLENLVNDIERNNFSSSNQTGVKVKSPIWDEIVDVYLGRSSGLIDIEKMVSKLAKLSDKIIQS